MADTYLANNVTGWASRLGTEDVGSNFTPMYLKEGAPLSCGIRLRTLHACSVNGASSMTLDTSYKQVYLSSETKVGQTIFEDGYYIFQRDGGAYSPASGLFLVSAQAYASHISGAASGTDYLAIRIVTDGGDVLAQTTSYNNGASGAMCASIAPRLVSLEDTTCVHLEAHDNVGGVYEIDTGDYRTYLTVIRAY